MTATATSRTRATKQAPARLEARISNDLHTTVKRAAKMQGRTMTDFVIMALQEEEAKSSPLAAMEAEYSETLKKIRNINDAIAAGIWNSSTSAVLKELEDQAARQGYRRVYLTTGFRQPEAVGLYLSHGYTALFDLHADPETIAHLPFEKYLPALLQSHAVAAVAAQEAHA